VNLLAADVGGTKTLLMLARWERGRLVPGRTRRYESGAYGDFESMAREFLATEGMEVPNVRAACLAIAGPVQRRPDCSRHARLTNLPWEVDSARLTGELGIPVVTLINDFEGIAHSLPVLPDSALVTLQRGEPDPGGPRLLVGAGTGFGVCTVSPDGTVLPGEGGHSGFAPTDAQQVRLWRFVAEAAGRCSREHLLSGGGIMRIAEFLRSEGRMPGPALTEALSREDPAAALSRFALQNADPLARDTLALFVRIFGAQTGDLALAVLPTGGVYVAGGIAPRILPLLQNGDFIAAFVSKPPMGQLLARLPIRLISDPAAGLLGAARCALQLAG
jgi:glucokinase